MRKLLKFLTCGSVDDGKSTLIGHLLYDAKLLFADQKCALELDSKIGSRGGNLDYSLLLDGLMAEREQGITIDVAYRYFSTKKRSFIVADAPGHEEYTRNMAVAAAFADLAVILIDVSKGILMQTHRHIRICNLMGIRHFIFALNKMDLLGYEQATYEKIKEEICRMPVNLDLSKSIFLPMSATNGDNIVTPSAAMPWYSGPTFLEYLESVDVDSVSQQGFLMSVQRVCRPNADYRGFQGEIDSGQIAVGDEISVFPSGERAKVRALDASGSLLQARKGRPVAISLDREIDISRGSVIAKDIEPRVSQLFVSDMLWMDDEPLIKGRNYILKLGTKRTSATVTEISYRVDIHTGQHIPTNKLSKNEIARVEITTSERIVIEPFAQHPSLGRYILINRVSRMTSACGVVIQSLRWADNLTWQSMDITRQARADRMGQKPVTLWFTGLSGAGKSTLANAVEKALFMRGKYTMLLDGDNIRMGLNRNLGFTVGDRVENIRRVAETAKLMNDAGLIVLVALISPYRADRQSAREIIGKENFIECYVSTPLSVCEQRDVKGLYKKARRGEIPNFTGISSPFEPPEHPTLVFDTVNEPIESSVERILGALGI